LRVTVQGYLDDKLKKAVSPEAKIFLLTSWYRAMYPYIPFVTGMLADNVEIKEDGIYFNQVYAGRQYFGDGFNFTKDQHPLAQARWGDVAWELDGEKIMNDFKQYIITKEE